MEEKKSEEAANGRVPWCEEHNKVGGKFGACLACATRDLTRALAHIDELVDPLYDGHPNGCSSYELDYDEKGVVARVEKCIKMPPAIRSMLAIAPPEVKQSEWFRMVVAPYARDAAGITELEAPAWGVQYEERGGELVAIFSVDHQYFTLARGEKNDEEAEMHVHFIGQMFLKAMEKLGLRPRGELRPSISCKEDADACQT